MKSLMLIAFVLLSLKGGAEAGGWSCNAQCLVIHPNEQAMWILKPVTKSSTLPKVRVFRLLQEKCREESREQGLGNLGILAQRIVFESAREDSYQNSSSDANVSGRVVLGQENSSLAARKIKTEKIKGLHFNQQSVIFANSLSAESHAETHSESHSRNLSVDLLPAHPADACAWDESLTLDQIPFEGTED